MKTNRALDVIALLIAFVPVGYLLLIYPQLPEQVPLRFSPSGSPDAYGPKSSLYLLAGILTGASLLILLVFRNLPRLDPKKNLQYSAGALQKMALGTALFIAMIGILSLRAKQTGQMEDLLGYLPFAAALLLAFISNYLTTIRPNYFAGFRTPWTLSNETVWRKTHQFGGTWLFWLCLWSVIPMLFLSPMGRMALLAVVVMMGVLYPVYYSYRLHREMDSSHRA